MFINAIVFRVDLLKPGFSFRLIQKGVNRKIKILCCCRQWEDAEFMVLLQVMYADLDFISTFNIELDVLQQFLYEVYRRYNNIPFHNFKHCFCVTQMVRVCASASRFLPITPIIHFSICLINKCHAPDSHHFTHSTAAKTFIVILLESVICFP